MMKRVCVAKTGSALSGQARTFVPFNVVSGFPVQTKDTTDVGSKTWFNWQSLPQPMNDAAIAKYGRGGGRVRLSHASDAGIDKADEVVYNTYEGGAAVAGKGRLSEEDREMLTQYPFTDKAYISSYLKPRAVDEYERRVKFYGMLAIPRSITLFMTKSSVVGLLLHFGPKADMKAAATMEVNIGNIEEGQIKTLMWMGKPIFIHHRDQASIDEANSVSVSELRDPEEDASRHQNVKWAIMIAICTHLGCIPVSGAGDWGAYFCPCHGSHYDKSGRIRKGPAPLNLEIPPYTFLDDATILIGK